MYINSRKIQFLNRLFIDFCLHSLSSLRDQFLITFNYFLITASTARTHFSSSLINLIFQISYPSDVRESLLPD